MMAKCVGLILGLALMIASGSAEKKFIGELNTLLHEVRGRVFFNGEQEIIIENFGYDGKGPDAFFYVGTSGKPLESGVKVPYPTDSNEKILEKADGVTVILELPGNLNTSDLAWISIWCRQFGVDFGSLMFSANSEASVEPEAENAATLASPSQGILPIMVILLAWLIQI